MSSRPLTEPERRAPEGAAAVASRAPRRDALRSGWTVLRLVNLRHLRGRPRRTAFTIGGIAAGISLVIAITALNATLRDAIDGTTRGLSGSARLEIAPAGPAPLGGAVVTRVRRAPGVAAAIPVARETARLRAGRATTRTMVFGVQPAIDRLFPDGLGAVGPQLAGRGFRRGALLTPKLAAALGVRPGQRITVETSRGLVRVPVAGTLARGPFAGVNGGSFALLSLATVQRTFARGHTVDAIYVTARAGAGAARLRAAVRHAVGGRGIVRPPGGGAQAYKRTFDSIASISEQARAVALFVALFLVLNTMSMSLAERREEIALLAIGGTRRAPVAGAFIAEAAAVGVLGGALGTLVGALLAQALIQTAVSSYNILPLTDSGTLTLSAADIALGIAGGAVVAMGAAAIAARRILRVAPVDALRPEAAYEWSARPERMPRFLMPTGLAALIATVAVAWLAPVGSHQWLAGLVLVTALAGVALLLPTLVPALVRVMERMWLRRLGVVGRLAAEAILRARGRATITAGALALAASVVVAVSAGLGSYQREVDHAASAWYAAPLYVNADGAAAFTSDQPLPASLAGRLAHVPGVAAAYPIRFGVLDDHGHQVVVYAMPIARAAAEGHEISRGVGISQGALVHALRGGDVILSRLAARRRHLHPGDTLVLSTAAGAHRMRVAALFNDVASFDSLYLEHNRYVRLTRDTTADRFAISLARGASARAVAGRIQRFLDAHHMPASVLTRHRMTAYVLDAVASLFSLARGIQIGALLIAALIVLNTMLTATNERRREFGLQRMLGMSRLQLAGSVVLEALALALVGAALAVAVGVGLGYLMTLAIENQLAWRMAFHPVALTTAVTALVTIAIGAVASFYPSWVASRQTVVGLLQDR